MSASSANNGSERIELTEEERRRVIAWADVCSGESKLDTDDMPLLEKLGGTIDALDRVRDAGRS